MRTAKKLFLLLLVLLTSLFAQNNSKKNSEAFVDKNGVLRWKGSNEEITLFGVNYTTPFAYAYRAHKKLGLDLKKAIDLDVAQMVRLGLDAFRVHVWDREIADRNGNLLLNEHLELFDYLIAKLSENGIKSIVTPIAWWGTGWPEPDIETPGFSQIYSKTELITNSDARKAQRNYLQQFINHVNPYTKYSYKDDPSIIAIEIINEPKHPNDEKQVTDYINEMYDVLRNAGLKKPIYYNISENWSDIQANAVSKSKAEGISFQWYPTGLVHNKVLSGNYLINVNKYPIPSKDVVGFNKKTKMVYEFDAADIGDAYMYPAMARSFRETGMQFAAMFAYDPSQIAWSNTEYPTHFLNLLYTPSKAVSLMIASKAFHSVKRNQSFSDYPSNNNFNEFYVDGINKLSVMNSDTEFYYSNSTMLNPKNPLSLSHIAGTGSSSLVKYDGTGAYFLDKIENGIWRLEVYPDVLWLRDPFEQTSMSRQVAKLFWNERRMLVNIPNLENNFVVSPISSDAKEFFANVNEFIVKPGIYLLYSSSVNKNRIQKYITKQNDFLSRLYVPENLSQDIYVINKTPRQAVTSDNLKYEFQIAGNNIANASLYVKQPNWRGFRKYSLKSVGGFNYVVDDTSKYSIDGTLQYCVTVETDKGIFTFPAGIQKSPQDWDFGNNELWSIKICKPGDPIVLVDALRDQTDFVLPQFNPSFRYFLNTASGSNSEKNSVSVKIQFTNTAVIPFGLQLNVENILKPFAANLDGYKNITIRGRSDDKKPGKFTVKMLDSDGICYSADFEFLNSWSDIKIPLSNFQNDYALILPNSYPLFLPKIWERNKQNTNRKLDLSKIQFIQIVCEKDKSNNENLERSFNLESIILE